MAARATTTKDPQLKLTQQSPAQRRVVMGEKLVEWELKRIEREKYLGQAKTVKNEMDELLESARQIARETVTGQLKLAIEEVFEETEDDTEEPEARRHPHSEDWTDEDDKAE